MQKNNNGLPAGINTELGSNCSRIAFGYAKKTFTNRRNKSGVLVPSVDGGFSSTMDFDGIKIGISSDGIGTKIEIAERMQKYNTLGFDLLAMTIDDLCCSGFIPAFVSNILDVDVLDSQIIDELMSGLFDAAAFSDVIITGGEIAELGNRISGFGSKMHFNWCATGIGKLHKSLQEPITGKSILKGDVVLSVYNPGFRSNGFSLIRRILSANFGENWHTVRMEGDTLWGDAVLTPCLLYSPLVEFLLDEGFIINGLAHITGGGVVDNLGRIIKHNGLGAELDNLWQPDTAMNRLLELGNVSLTKAYNYFNMGNGMLIVVPENQAEQIVKACEQKTQYRIKNAGRVIDEKIIRISTAEQQLVYTEYYSK